MRRGKSWRKNETDGENKEEMLAIVRERLVNVSDFEGRMAAAEQAVSWANL